MQSWVEMVKKGKKAIKSSENQGLETKQDYPPQSNGSKSPALKPKPKTAAERKKDRIEGIWKTIYPSVIGVLAGFFCYYTLGIADQRPMQWLSTLLFVIAATYIIQKYTFPFLKVNANEFKSKDWFYVEFIAIDLWLVTWTLLLN
jgi:EMC6-arch